MSGSWTIRVKSINASWQQGFRLAGTSAHDGDWLASPNLTVPLVTSSNWSIQALARPSGSSPWMVSRTRDRMSFDPVEGIRIAIGCDDGPPPGDLDFDDLVLECITDDPLLKPKGQNIPPIQIPEGRLGRQG